MKSSVRTARATAMFVAAALALLGGGGCATTGGSSASIDTTVRSTLPPYDGPRARVRLAEFKVGPSSGGRSEIRVKGPDGEEQTVTWNVEAQNQVLGGLKELLKGAMLETGRFEVLGREETFTAMKDEYAEGQDGWVQEREEIRKGQVVGPDLIVNAVVTKWAPNTSGRSVGLGALAGGLLGGVKVGSRKSEVGLTLEIYDVRTQVLLASVRAEGVASSKSLGLGGVGWGGGGAAGGVLSEYADTPMEDAIAKAIQAAADGVARKVPSRYLKHT